MMSGMNFREIVNLWPSMADLSADLGERYETVRKWRGRNRIPSEYWTRIVRAAKKRRLKVTIEMLAQCEDEVSAEKAA